jgi:hypothetical protein
MPYLHILPDPGMNYTLNRPLMDGLSPSRLKEIGAVASSIRDYESWHDVWLTLARQAEREKRWLDAASYTASLNDNRDDWCFGFDSAQLAAALNITTDSLFQANRHRKLTLENVEASTPDGEMALIKRYTFRVGANEMSLSVQTLGRAGSA